MNTQSKTRHLNYVLFLVCTLSAAIRAHIRSDSSPRCVLFWFKFFVVTVASWHFPLYSTVHVINSIARRIACTLLSLFSLCLYVYVFDSTTPHSQRVQSALTLTINKRIFQGKQNPVLCEVGWRIEESAETVCSALNSTGSSSTTRSYLSLPL